MVPGNPGFAKARLRSRGPYAILPAVRTAILLQILILPALLSAGCGADAGASGRLMVAGSTSVQPLAESLAHAYMGSVTGAVAIEIQGGGSSTGIQAARSGAAEIGMSSRLLKEGETDLTPRVVALDALVVIVHPSSDLAGLPTARVRDLFSGAARDWSDVGRARPGRITAVTREEGSGTRAAFEELAMRGVPIEPRCLVQDSQGAVREIVAADPDAVGYISVGLADARVKALAVDGVAPTPENLEGRDRRYRLIRPLLFVTRGAMTPAALGFVAFIDSPEGERIVRREGYLPGHE